MEKRAGFLKQMDLRMHVGFPQQGPMDQAAYWLVIQGRAWPGGREEGTWASESLRPGFESHSPALWP